MDMPEQLTYYTADEVAECFDFEDTNDGALYRKLWGFVNDAQNPTPLGGDGTDGTVETPDGRLDLDNDDKAAHWWGKLTEAEQQAIANCLDPF